MFYLNCNDPIITLPTYKHNQREPLLTLKNTPPLIALLIQISEALLELNEANIISRTKSPIYE